MPREPQSRPPEELDLLDVASMFRERAPSIARELEAAQDPISDQALQAVVLGELATARWPLADVRVRPDRPPARTGTWRFNLLVERSDRVSAAIEICSGKDALERQVLALSRLSLALGRGIADRGFLVATAPVGSGLWINPAVGASDRVADPYGRDSCLIVRAPVAGRDPAWELAVIEARRPRSQPRDRAASRR